MIAPSFELRHTFALANADSGDRLTAAVRRNKNERQVTSRKRQQPFSSDCALGQGFGLQPACKRQQSRTQNPCVLPAHSTRLIPLFAFLHICVSFNSNQTAPSCHGDALQTRSETARL